MILTHAQRLHVDIDLHDAQPERPLDRELDALHDVVRDLADAQAMLQHDVEINRDMIIDEMNIHAAPVMLWAEGLDQARPGCLAATPTTP